MYRKKNRAIHPSQREFFEGPVDKNRCEDCDPNNKKKCLDCSHAECFEWVWDPSSADRRAEFKDEEKHVLFNPGFSTGTVVVRGTDPLLKGDHHFFEIEMSTEVYGTDMMIGVGTEKTNLTKFTHHFVSFLGFDEESWGLSYNGDIQHNGFSKAYTSPFSQGDVIGVHLDLWTGTLEYYLNRQPLGIAFRNLQNKTLYPMISSTAARSGMTLSYAKSFKHTLELQVLLSLGRNTFWPQNASVFKCHNFPPGLRTYIRNNFWWVTCSRDEKPSDESGRLQKGMRLRRKKAPSTTDDPDITSPVPLNSPSTSESGKSTENLGSAGSSGIRHVPENKRLRLRSFNRS